MSNLNEVFILNQTKPSQNVTIILVDRNMYLFSKWRLTTAMTNNVILLIRVSDQEIVVVLKGSNFVSQFGGLEWLTPM